MVIIMKDYLQVINEVIANGKYKDTWDSLMQFEVPNWFKKAKFGIFIHWGLYSVPANSNEWYSRNMYIKGMPAFEHHVKTYGPQNEFGYKDFIPLFKAEKFNADEWAKAFKNAGAKYIFPVAEHHDGFQMYKSEISHFNAYEMGPKRDVLGELKEAFDKEGITFCTSSHRAEHWFFMGHGKEFDSDIKDPMEKGDFYWPAMPEPDNQDLFSDPYPNEEFLEDWLIRTCEIIDNYKPKALYFDWWIQHEAFKPYLRKVAAYYYNRAEEWGVEVAITYKHDAFMFGSGIVEIERGKFADQKPYYWQTDTAVAKNTWCYTEENDYKESREIICDLIDIVSKNGNMLLNVGPKADGTIPEGDAKILREIGAWLDVNGEAIFDSKVWRKSGEGPTKVEEGQFQDNQQATYTGEDIRFTVRGSYLYATFLNYPADGKVMIRSLVEAKDQNKPEFHGIIRDVEVLGFEEKPVWSRSEEGLSIQTTTVKSDYPVVVKIEID
jgi:alpha-L-fucosidase